ncbi:hypothetical protein E2C01_050292 [Portunus trituberculatus]|uniref:Uncharacterized protein n=1 Tax=Portunus trituberculatus TaxID=210409 RepID=A0A5B7GFH6_PORTR|nr:hypothetical protein [Portunus trituberculatus]
MPSEPRIPSPVPAVSEAHLSPSPAPSSVTCAPPLTEDDQNGAAGPLPHACKTISEQASSGSGPPPPGPVDRRLIAVPIPRRSTCGRPSTTRTGPGKPPKAPCHRTPLASSIYDGPLEKEVWTGCPYSPPPRCWETKEGAERRRQLQAPGQRTALTGVPASSWSSTASFLK